jgi:hypothetical protein
MCFCSTDVEKTESKEKFFGGSLSLAFGLRTVINPRSGKASAALRKTKKVDPDKKLP